MAPRLPVVFSFQCVRESQGVCAFVATREADIVILRVGRQKKERIFIHENQLRPGQAESSSFILVGTWLAGQLRGWLAGFFAGGLCGCLGGWSVAGWSGGLDGYR